MLLRLLPALVLTLTAAAAPAQITPIERLATAGKLWARIHYFHPWLAVKDVDWDRAFVDAAPKILAAQSKDEYAAALNGMLATLGDPATYVLPLPAPGRARDASFRRDGDIVIFDPGKLSNPSFQKLLPQITAELAKNDVSALVVDARDSTGAYSWPGSLTVHSTPGLTLVQRFWMGYPPPAGSSPYSHRLVNASYYPVEGSPEGVAKPIVVLADERSSVDSNLVALQVAGKIGLVLEGDHVYNTLSVRTAVQLGEGLAAWFRSGEYIHADGSYGIVPQREVKRGAGLNAALELARAGAIQPVTTRPRGWHPRFWREKPYDEQPYPPEGLRLLGALRVWSVMEHFMPHKYLIGEDWGSVLAPALAEVREANDALAYHLAIKRLGARTNDAHTNVYSRPLSDYVGPASPPFLVRWIEGKPVIVRVTRDAGAASGIGVGDVIIALNGQSMLERIRHFELLEGGSTPQAVKLRALYAAVSGKDGATVRFTLEGENGVRRDAELVMSMKHYAALAETPDPPFRLLNERVGYANLKTLEVSQVDAMFAAFVRTEAIIFDMRGYPRGAAFPIASRLTETAGDPPVAALNRWITNLGGFIQNTVHEQRIDARGEAPPYKGRTVMLIDDRAGSQAEHSGLFLRAANGTRFIGEATAGADGNTTFFTVPGGIRVRFAAMEVRWPDGRQLQRMGILPDIPVAPTIRGLREGRDEVLEKALDYLRQ